MYRADSTTLFLSHFSKLRGFFRLKGILSASTLAPFSKFSSRFSRMSFLTSDSPDCLLRALDETRSKLVRQFYKLKDTIGILNFNREIHPNFIWAENLSTSNGLLWKFVNTLTTDPETIKDSLLHFYQHIRVITLQLWKFVNLLISKLSK